MKQAIRRVLFWMVIPVFISPSLSASSGKKIVDVPESFLRGQVVSRGEFPLVLVQGGANFDFTVVELDITVDEQGKLQAWESSAAMSCFAAALSLTCVNGFFGPSRPQPANRVRCGAASPSISRYAAHRLLVGKTSPWCEPSNRAASKSRETCSQESNSRPGWWLRISNRKAKRYTFEKCVFEAYLAFRGVGGKKPDEGRGRWAQSHLDKNTESRTVSDLASKYHEPSQRPTFPGGSVNGYEPFRQEVEIGYPDLILPVKLRRLGSKDR